MADKFKVYRSALIKADEPNGNGNVYPKEVLQKMAEESENFQYENGVLYFALKI